MTEPLVSITSLVKLFSGVPVVNYVDLNLYPGRLHALLGPNGAGKSTIIKILSGVYRADGGTVDTRSRDGGPGCRIGFIHQNLALVDGLNVRENLNLDRGGVTWFGMVIRKRAEFEHAVESLANVDTNLDPETPLIELSLGEKTLVATARLFNKSIDVMVLDETSAALTRGESEWLYREARKFADSGGAVLVVSHRLREMTDHCDEVTVMRDGAVVYFGPTPQLNELHELMSAGSADVSEAAHLPELGAKPVVSISGAETEFVGPFDLSVASGEVIALVGPLSSNLYQVGHAIAGRSALISGKREVQGEVVAFVPENCQAQAMLPGLSIRENMTISAVSKISRFGYIGAAKENEEVAVQMTALDIQPPDPDVIASLLSGGNQQKVIIGRAALTNPRCYVLCEPTRGVDIKTRNAIYRFIRRVSSEGAAVVIITIDVDDAFAVADRIGLVRAHGQVETPEPRESLTVGKILAEVDA